LLPEVVTAISNNQTQTAETNLSSSQWDEAKTDDTKEKLRESIQLPLSVGSCVDDVQNVVPGVVVAEEEQDKTPISPVGPASQFHPAGVAAAEQEVSLSMACIYHDFSRKFDLVSRLPTNNGTCNIQLLRSVGPWSIGTSTEMSIMNCYLESIRNAQRFIYIENQFFIGSNAGDGVANSIPQVIVERILKAYHAKEPFRVIILIPLHPNGDFCNASKSKVVMHYEYATINRGVKSMFQQLRAIAPALSVNNYIGFFCLRNWGVINNKIVTEQIYVHDKVMIVDDRVLIIGSANINDRSMLGHRDSELAVRIEDTLHVDAKMDGKPFTVGFLPQQVRLQLMRQHVADESFGKYLISASCFNMSLNLE
jgi:phosphatidylserine/phosphatidylglycerophosphate/cardiolipin synthase-like enzyme